MNPPSLQQLYETYPGYRQSENETEQVGAIPVSFMRVTQLPFEATDPPMSDFVMAVALNWGWISARREVSIGIDGTPDRRPIPHRSTLWILNAVDD